MIGFALFRGLRIGEIRAINIRDFKNPDFNKIDIILQKSNILDEFPIIEDFAILLKKYVLENLHLMKDGYLFPTYSKLKKPYIGKNVTNVMFYKYRQKLIKKYPAFAEQSSYWKYPKQIEPYYRYRVGWHSMRRWFETTLFEHGYKPEEIAQIMRYKDPRTVYTYLNLYNTYKEEKKRLNETLGNIFKNMIHFDENQKTISEFIN